MQPLNLVSIGVFLEILDIAIVDPISWENIQENENVRDPIHFESSVEVMDEFYDGTILLSTVICEGGGLHYPDCCPLQRQGRKHAESYSLVYNGDN